MAKFVPGLSEIYSETDNVASRILELIRAAHLGDLCRLRDGKNTDCDDCTPFCLPVALEAEERNRSRGQKEYGFGSGGCSWRDRKDRRAGRCRGHRCGKK